MGHTGDHATSILKRVGSGTIAASDGVEGQDRVFIQADAVIGDVGDRRDVDRDRADGGWGDAVTGADGERGNAVKVGHLVIDEAIQGAIDLGGGAADGDAIGAVVSNSGAGKGDGTQAAVVDADGGGENDTSTVNVIDGNRVAARAAEAESAVFEDGLRGRYAVDRRVVDRGDADADRIAVT